MSDRRSYRRPLAAFAHGPVADDAPHTAAELGRVPADLGRLDTDAMTHD